MKKQEIKLGQKVRDLVTGLVGIAIAKCEFMNGCIQYGVKPSKLKEGTPRDAEYIDVQQLEIIGDGLIKKIEKKDTGGHYSDVPRKNNLMKV
ncbi:MAG: hypothetical protein WCW53_02660 [Syntrophales bacterium]|jgi:hypothetical protein